MPSFGVIVPAAGGSSRLGRPKQLLPFAGRTLIEHAVRTALESGAADVVVVLGADAENVEKCLRDLPVRTVVNPSWPDGMGGSIARGAAALDPSLPAVVVALVDQPRITPDHLHTLVETLFHEECDLVASSYDGILGAPCAFAAPLLPELLSLAGDAGMRNLIRKGGYRVEPVPFIEAQLDIDTELDYQALLATQPGC